MSAFVLGEPLPAPAGKRKVFVTGAAGNIGAYFAERNAGRYDLTLMVRHAGDAAKLEKFGRVVQGDLANLDQLGALFAGHDAVLHLAGDPSPEATWDSLLAANVVGTYHVFVAAKARGVRKVIYASSIHAISGYPPDVQVKDHDPVNPGDLYGVTKCFGEALARYMAEREGVRAVALRIGAFQPPSSAEGEGGVRMLDAWVSRRDLDQLIAKCVDDDRLVFAIFSGLSDNRFKRMDVTPARQLVGYAPRDDTTEANDLLAPLDLDAVSSHSMQDAGQKSGLRDDLAEAK